MSQVVFPLKYRASSIMRLKFPVKSINTGPSSKGPAAVLPGQLTFNKCYGFSNNSIKPDKIVTGADIIKPDFAKVHESKEKKNSLNFRANRIKSLKTR